MPTTARACLFGGAIFAAGIAHADLGLTLVPSPTTAVIAEAYASAGTVTDSDTLTMSNPYFNSVIADAMLSCPNGALPSGFSRG